ncbi:hypothetical protein EPN16_06145 [bacterium]|nr:MAG: hypothetical protein EPN16_06145 [bacterium]
MCRRNKFIVIIIFSAIILSVIIFFARGRGLPAGARAPAKRAEGIPVKEAEFIYDAREKRNPFMALIGSDGRILEPRISRKRDGVIDLEGIIYDSGSSSYAVINGEIVKAGEAAGDYQLIRIEPQKIILSKEGKELEVELNTEE